uniref:Pentatricopeptide repeat-containing protein At2g30780 family n=2 Tax=Cajanus cajan TaxID=3821 RepID=A0A151TUG3_CAJCA|nr:Pentatricopeptide repeat-containing protein At2g30780 family [Cajanus cajan]
MDAYEYSKGIKAAGRSANIEFAVMLFKEAAIKGIKKTITYNALMSVFMVNGLADWCQSLFCDLKRDPTCDPSIATYNILISVFGGLMLVDHMEATFREIQKLDLAMNIYTYNYLIAGYLTAWMWDDMEKVFQMLMSGPVEPNMKTYMLMLRGYANSGNLDKMEEMYSLVSDHVNENGFKLISCMICAYSKSSEVDRLEKIEALMKFIPKEDYRPWLNVLLIKLYAKEDCLEKMENAINEAFQHGTSITTNSIMRCIIATYFRCNAVEKLESFVRRAEISGWVICRSLYHCKLVMYGSQGPLIAMHNVLQEMENVKLDCTKKTLWIMYKAYMSRGQGSMVLKTLGQMFKHGYEVPLGAFPS